MVVPLVGVYEAQHRGIRRRQRVVSLQELGEVFVGVIRDEDAINRWVDTGVLECLQCPPRYLANSGRVGEVADESKVDRFAERFRRGAHYLRRETAIPLGMILQVV